MNTVEYYQNGIKLVTIPNNNGIEKPVLIHSERFYPVTCAYPSLSIAEQLIMDYSQSKALLTEVAKGLTIAEIGGYYFFSDGSELSI